MSEAITPAVEACSVSKSFGGVQALRGVSFVIDAGTTTGLVGENGAGKSTLVAVLTGALAPDRGSIKVQGLERSSLDPAAARSNGIAAIRQEPVLIPTLSVAENFRLGRDGGSLRLFRRRAIERECSVWLERVGARFRPTTFVEQLSPADRQLVEIARAVGAGARVFLFDEPTAALGPAETERLFELINGLTAEGAAVAYVSHRLEEIFALCSRVVVLRDGSVVGEEDVSKFDESRLVTLMAGEELAADEDKSPRTSKAGNSVLLALHRIALREGAEPFDLEVRCGEIHGVGGIAGAGRSRLASVLCGLRKPTVGTMTLDGTPYAPRGPRDALARGVALVPEDRLRAALFGELSLATNTLISDFGLGARHGLICSRSESNAARPSLERLDVRPLSPGVAARTLSGGNQQKVVIARALRAARLLIVLDEPTRGVDVRTKAEIHGLIRRLADDGLGVVVVSSDLRELLTLSDRITVLARGQRVATYDGGVSGEHVMAAAVGVAE